MCAKIKQCRWDGYAAYNFRAPASGFWPNVRPARGLADSDARDRYPAPYAEDKVTGSSNDGRPGADGPPGDEQSTIPDGRCPRCGRALPGYVCLHCAGEDEFGDAELVRRFVSFPDLYSKDTSPQSWPDADPDEWAAPGDQPPPRTPSPEGEKEAAVPAAYRDRFGATPTGSLAVRARHLLDPAGWGPRGILAKALITCGSILLAGVVGIAGAVFTGPAATGPGGAPSSSSTPSSETAPGAVPALPARAATGAVIHGSFCLDNHAGGTDNGSPVQLWECDNNATQRWTFATDGTVRVSGRCLRPVGGGSAYGTTVELWECDRSASQQWLRGSGDSLLHPASGGCLEDPGPGTAQGSLPRLAVCRSGPDQRWNLP